MPGVIASIPKFQFSANGVPMVGGTLTAYIAGSTTPTTTWQDSALSIANTNPVTLDSRGECVLWLDPAIVYKFILKNAQGVIQWTQDNIKSAANIGAANGATLIGANAYQTQDDVNLERVSVKRFGASPLASAAINDAAFVAAINACPVGGTLMGLGVVYKSTGLTVGKAITIDGLTLELIQKAYPQTSQDAFTIAANGVTLRNCGATITEAALPATANSAGVYSSGYDAVVVDGGEWDGSINKSYTPGNYRGVIYIENGTDCIVKNTVTRNAFGEGLWVNNCTQPQVLNNYAYNAGGSEIVCYVVGSGLVHGNKLVGNAVAGNSGMAVGGDNIIVSNNEIIDASGWGISHGELASAGGRITGNLIKGHGKLGTAGNWAGILSQHANGLVVAGNTILAPTAGATAFGISFANTPISFVCENNKIEKASLQGIYCLDGTGAMLAVIRGNSVDSSAVWGIFSGGAKTLDIESNIVRNSNTSGSQPAQIYIQNPVGTPDYIRAVNNVVNSNNANSLRAIFLATPLTSATQYIHRNNLLLNWASAPYDTGRAVTYDVRGDTYAIGPRGGLVALTSGGTATVVTSAQISAKSVISLNLGNAAAATLNPVYRISAQGNGSFTITHTAGTAAGEQIQWAIV